MKYENGQSRVKKMKIPEKLKQYLKESPQTWDDIHILDYDCNGISESRYLSENVYKAIEEYASSEGKIPVLGRIWSGNPSAEYPFKFHPNGYACGGYSYDGVNNTSTVLRIEGSKVVETDRATVSELLAPDQLTDYLCFRDLETCREALLEIILFECGVKSGVEKCALWANIFIADLTNACSYYGSGETIYPPNHVDADSNESRVQWLEENQALVLTQEGLERIIQKDNRQEFPEVKEMMD